jgi:hypothetical protein
LDVRASFLGGFRNQKTESTSQKTTAFWEAMEGAEIVRSLPFLFDRHQRSRFQRPQQAGMIPARV